MKSSTKLLSLAAVIALTACAPADPLLSNPAAPTPTPAPKKLELVTDSAKVRNQYESPKVDILFVMDNSVSMEKHQDKLVASIDRFAEAFLANTEVDFHVGVVKVYDKNFPAQNIPNGQLLGGYITRSANTVNQLKTLLKVGVSGTKDGGPEYEEIFSPIKAALTEPNLSKANAGFYRPEAHLAIIMITDANDSSVNFDETNLEAFLYQLKGKRPDKYSLYGVLAIPTSTGADCTTDPSGAPKRINDLLKNTGGHKFSLCEGSGYGSRLAKVGSDITAKAVFSRVVELTNIPDPSEKITVMCEGKEIPQGANGWSYDARSKEYKVVVSSTYPECKSDDAEIQVTYARMKSGQLDSQR